MSDKNYISGSAKARETQYGEILNLSLKFDDLKKIVNEKGYVNLTVSKRKELGKFGDTHTVTENNWKPETRNISPKEAKEAFDDVPF